MTINNTQAQVTYNGNGSQTYFSYNFRIPYQDDGTTPAVILIQTGASGNITYPQLGTDFTIAGVDNSDGGSVVFPITGSSYATLASGWTLQIARNLAYTQGTSFPNQGLFPQDIETALDRMEMQLQQKAALYNGTQGPQGPAGATGPAGPTGPQGPSVAVDDEGTQLTASATSLNFVGAGVTATASGNDVTVTIPGGGGSSGLTVGTSTIASGTDGRILYDNAGVLGEYTTVPVALGGTGTSTPGLVAGTNVTISGSWPNQTINSSGGGGGGATYEYAAIQYMYSSNGAYQLAGLDFQNAAGTSLVGGGTALGNGANPGNAFDGNASTDTSGGNWIGYHFTSAVAVGKVVMTAANSIFSDRTPLIYDIVVSHDGKTWKPLGKVIDTALFANGEVRTYTIPS